MGFTSGSNIVGAEVQALYDLTATKCSEGGVTGPSAGRAVHASGQPITAVNTNDMVAAYQRAWNRSGNQPGTLQSQVASGGPIIASRYQAMSDQLGTMIFGTGYTGSGYAAKFNQYLGTRQGMYKPAATFGGTGTVYNYTISVWFTIGRRYNLDQYQGILSTTGGGAGISAFRVGPGTGTVEMREYSSNYYVTYEAPLGLGWNHLVVNYNCTRGTAENRWYAWLNGQLLRSYYRAAFPPQSTYGTQLLGYQGHDMQIGGYSGTNQHDGMMADLIVCDGLDYDYSYFAEEVNGIWMPKNFSGSYGSRGFKMGFTSGSVTTPTAGDTTAWTAYNSGYPLVVPAFPHSTLPSLDHQFLVNLVEANYGSYLTEVRFYDASSNEYTNAAISQMGGARAPMILNDGVSGESTTAGSYGFDYGVGGWAYPNIEQFDLPVSGVGAGISRVRLCGETTTGTARTYKGGILSKKVGDAYWRPRAKVDFTETSARYNDFTLSTLPYWEGFGEWDETTQSTLASSTTAVCVFDGASGTNETTSGPASYTVTQVGTFPGVASNPWSTGRGVTNDNGNHYFTMDPTMWDWALNGRNQFTFLMKVSGGQNPAGNQKNYGTLGGSVGYGGLVVNLGDNRLQFNRDSGGYNCAVTANGTASGYYSVVGGSELDWWDGPAWLGIWSRADGIWAGVSVGQENRPVCHDGWMYKRQLHSSRQTFSAMSGGYGYCGLFNGYNPGSNYGMRCGIAHYFILSQNEFYNN